MEEDKSQGGKEALNLGGDMEMGEGSSRREATFGAARTSKQIAARKLANKKRRKARKARQAEAGCKACHKSCKIRASGPPGMSQSLDNLRLDDEHMGGEEDEEIEDLLGRLDMGKDDDDDVCEGGFGGKRGIGRSGGSGGSSESGQGVA
ncbi:hypothetical protein DSL72_006731 [Monilinia vaccinii-corymbosi]|uniref:Uncharacterized protein n=1 Tax=Monilinia vaccinii-corymbosi TaxID=61207 RepID=A0A8A3PN57_9HELO|nr:hypothetical protein DSL72_006731 [Monilinia vaccinii-corymbosi]